MGTTWSERPWVGRAKVSDQDRERAVGGVGAEDVVVLGLLYCLVVLVINFCLHQFIFCLSDLEAALQDGQLVREYLSSSTPRSEFCEK